MNSKILTHIPWCPMTSHAVFVSQVGPWVLARLISGGARQFHHFGNFQAIVVMTKHQQGTQHESSSQSNVEDILRKHAKMWKNYAKGAKHARAARGLLCSDDLPWWLSASKFGTMSPPGSITTLILPTLQVADIRSSKHVGHGHQWTSMDINGHQWTSMDINGHQWTSMDINGHRVSKEIVHPCPSCAGICHKISISIRYP